MKRYVCLALACIMSLAMLAACAPGATTTTPTTAPASGGTTAPAGTTTAPEGIVSARDTYNFGLYAEPTTMDPALAKDRVTWLIGYQLYDTLVKYDVIAKEYTPGLATSWNLSDSGTEITFELRQGVKFHNGDVMTADDVVWSLQRSIDSEYTSSLSGSMDHVEKVDDTHIKLVLKYAYAPIYDALITPCYGIASKRAVEEAESAGVDFGRNPCGTGAYKLVEWKSGEKMVFERFDDYYMGTPYIKTVNVIQIPDGSSGAIALEEGSIDFYLYLNTSDYEHLSGLGNIQRIEPVGGVGLNDITFNVTDGVFANKLLRQAVAYALDRDAIIKGGADGYAEISNCFCATSSFGYMDDYQWYTQDLEKAKQLVIDAGFPQGVDVVFTQEGSTDYMKPAEVMQDQLRKIGINVTFVKLERSAWIEQVGTNRQYDASLRMTTMVINDADYLLTRRLTSGSLGGGNNYSGYQNTEFDKKVEEARKLSDPAARLAIYRECYDILKEDVPFIPLFTSINPRFADAKLMGFQNHPQDRTPWNTLYFVD